MRTLKKNSWDKGFGLVEVMVAIVVLGLSVVGIISMNTASVGGNAAASITTQGVNIATRHIETLMTLDNGHAWVLDNNGNGGTDRDANINWIDDDDETTVEGGEDGTENYGLDEIAGADSTIVTDDNEFDIFWNVATDRPVPNVDTIRVIVRPRKGILNRRTVTVDFLRPRLF